MVHVNVVRADSNSVAVGGDFSITINVEDAAGVLKLAANHLNLPTLASSANHGIQTADQIAGGILMVAQTGIVEMTGAYDAFFTEADKFRNNVQGAEAAFRSQQFGSAHRLYGAALDTAPAEIKPQVVFDYVASGYVAYSLQSDGEGLRALLDRCDSQFVAHMDARLKMLIAEAHQEVATRQESGSMLMENDRLLCELETEVGKDDLRLLNLRGLLFRRLGERPENSDEVRLEYLSQAVSIFQRINAVADRAMGAEILNNWAISLIRTFELTTVGSWLDEAEAVLNKIDFGAKSQPLNDFLALPKGLNNLGNIGKQRLQHTKDSHWYSFAIENYGKAEKYWTESDTPYEWAMIKKNMADVRCVSMEVSGFSKKTAEVALSEIEESLKYRNAANAPYQYRRSMEVKLKLEGMLATNH